MASSGSGKLTLLLVGRTGNGKSSTGNSILRKKPFTLTGSTAAVTADILTETADVNGQEITVVDGPGIGDASFDNYKEIQATLNQVDEALGLCSNGFNALLIVLKYGIRFTQQEKDAITMIKAIFGPDVVRKYGVIVMSHGDSFELDTEDEEMTFEDWCKEQTGDVKALFTECDNRYVLFNNRSKDEKILSTQYESLMGKVKKIQVENYTLKSYKEAEKGRKQLIARSKLPDLEKETEKVLEEISNQLDQLGSSRDNNVEWQEKLDNCKTRISSLKEYLQTEDADTGCTRQLQMNVDLLDMRIEEKLKMPLEQAKEAKVTNMASSKSEKLTLLLVGRTGNGKSSTGNSILRKKPFTPTGSTAAVTAKILEDTADINGREITVVDGPGIGDASFDNYDDIQKTLDHVDEALGLCTSGFSAMLIVLKYGIRFTQQEKDAIIMIKSIFGPDVVRKYGVIVMSHGDSFELDTEDEKTTFEDWCKEQTGDVKALFTECDNRCVLFNNRSKDEKTLSTQYESLMGKVKKIQVENYTLKSYEEAEKGRKELIARSKLPDLEKKTEKVLEEISTLLDQLGSSSDNNVEWQEKLDNCMTRISSLKEYLQKEDADTGCTRQLQMNVDLLDMRIKTKLKTPLEQTKQTKKQDSWFTFSKVKAAGNFFKDLFLGD